MARVGELAGIGTAYQREDGRIWNGMARLDSRQIRYGDMFVALRGTRTDGHLFLDQALADGAAVVLAERGRTRMLRAAGEWRAIASPAATGTVIIETENVAESLAKIAYRRRKAFAGKVVGITGSMGKTTLKEFLCQGIRHADATEGNRNNHLGVPETILNMNPHATTWVVEMGMNHPGELDQLGRIVCPEIVVYTPLGRAHAGGGEGAWIAEAKTELLRLPEPPGEVWIPTNSRAYLRFCEDFSGHVQYYGENTDLAGDPAPDLRILQKEERFPGSANALVADPLGQTTKITWDIPFADYAAAAALAWHLGEGFQTSFLLASATAGRMNVRTISRGTWLVNDAYNASPESMLAAAHWVGRRVEEGYRVAVLLGEMRELGHVSAVCHAQTLDAWKASGGTLAFWRSLDAWPIEGAEGSVFERAGDWLKNTDADIYLAKGSNGTGLFADLEALGREKTA